jgi:hypothetical protein
VKLSHSHVVTSRSFVRSAFARLSAKSLYSGVCDSELPVPR